MSLAEPHSFRFTRDQYYRMADLGLFEGRRVELIEGEVVAMPAQKNPHALSITVSDYALRRVFSAGYFVRVQLPFRISDLSEPEPDLAVISGSPRDYTDHPRAAALLIEVADATLTFDRKTKGPLYATAGIADYWIVNLKDRCLEVYRDPAPDLIRGGFGYAAAKTLFPPDTISPLAAPDSMIKVSDLLP